MRVEVEVPSKLIHIDPATFSPRLIEDIKQWLYDHKIQGWQFRCDQEWNMCLEEGHVMRMKPQIIFEHSQDAVLFKIAWL